MGSELMPMLTLTQKPPIRGGKLLLLQEVDDLVAVLALVLAARDVEPVDVAVAERSNSESLKCGDKSKSFIAV